MKLHNAAPFLLGPIRRRQRSRALRSLLSEFVKPGDLVFRGADVVIDPRALSDQDGIATLRIPQASTIASMAPDWIRAVKDSGRFSEFDWADREEIQTIRLQAAIEQYGKPVFCKIDVEGNEEAVIAGLDVPIRALSLEFTPEHRDGLIRAVERLASLGEYEWNFVPFASDGSDTSQFAAGWMRSPELVTFLDAYEGFEAGNIYGRRLLTPRLA